MANEEPQSVPGTNDPLRKEVVAARRRRAWRTVIVAALAAQVAAAWLLRPRERERIVHTSSTQIVTLPAPLPVEQIVHVPADRPACPLPRTDAPFVMPARVPETIDHVRPSVTNAGWIAAWNDAHVYVSRDAGASWRRVLDGDGVVQDVTFDCYGHAIAMRDDRVGIRDGETERWRRVPGLRTHTDGWPRTVLLGGGPDVVVIGHVPAADWTARLVVSHDLGTTWRSRDLDYWEGGGVRGRQHEDGTILAMLPQADCMSESPWVFRWKDGVLQEIETYADVDLAFFDDDRIVSNVLWHRIGSKQTHDLPELDDDAYPTVLEGPYPIFVTSHGAYRLDGRRATRLPWIVATDAEGLVADPAGRIWGVACGQPYVATRGVAPCPVH